MSKIETINKESKRANKAATCLNSLRGGYSAKDAIEDMDLAIKAAEASRNRGEPGGTPKGQNILVYFKKMVNKEKMEAGLTFC